MIRDMIKEILYYKDMTQLDLANAIGLGSQSAVATRLAHTDSVDKFVELVKGMDCDLIIRSKDGKEWVL